MYNRQVVAVLDFTATGCGERIHNSRIFRVNVYSGPTTKAGGLGGPMELHASCSSSYGSPLSLTYGRPACPISVSLASSGAGKLASSSARSSSCCHGVSPIGGYYQPTPAKR